MTNVMKNSETQENPVTNGNLISGPEENNNPAMHFMHMRSHTRRTSGVVGNSGDGEGWRRSAWELGPRASSTADGSMRELQVIDCLIYIESFELSDEECLRSEKATSIHSQDQHRSELVVRHVQEHVQRQFTTMHGSKLDPFAVGQDEVQSIDNQSG